MVHFIFDPCTTNRVTPFTRKFKLLLEGDLEQFEREEHEKFEKYLDMYVDEALDENDRYPVVYERNEFYDLELYTMSHISFSLADNPYFKMDTEKYYPEALILSSKGTVLAHLGASRSSEGHKDFPGLKYRQGFRDERMRVNDDRKIEMVLSEFTEPGIQVILLVRSFDLRNEKEIPENAYDEAWFRLQNETTSQTLDYTKVKKLELPEDYQETLEANDDEDALPNSRNELIFIAGRVYREDFNPRTKKAQAPKWIYERLNQVTTSQKFPDIHKTLADLCKSASEEVEFYDSEIKHAQEKLAAAAEERKAAAIAAAAKKKASTKKGKKEEHPVEVHQEDSKPAVSRNMLPGTLEEDDQDLDLFNPDQFLKAIRQKFSRRFTFGPVEFSGLDT